MPSSRPRDGRRPPCRLRVAAGLLVALVALAAPGTRLAAQRPEPLTVAAASDLQSVLPHLIDQFGREGGGPVRVTYGSSGTFFAQIRNGAPFDVFLSADIDYPRQLIAAGLADGASLTEYAAGRLALIARRDGGLDPGRGLVLLRDPRVRRIAIANPQHAPYGRAAVDTLRRQGLYEAVRPRLVLGESVAQAAQFVQSGNADMGLVALSLALAPPMRATVASAPVPAAAHPPIRQGAVALRATRQRESAARFLAFLRRPSTTALLGQFGFAPPAGGD